MPEPIRVLLAEDSPTTRHHLYTLVQDAGGLQVVGEARTGVEAVQRVAELRPHIVSMDILMPEMDGLEATRQIMMHTPTPVVVVSSILDSDVQLSLQALEAGALAVVRKPPERQHPDFYTQSQQFLNTLKTMASVKVVGRRYYPLGNGDDRPITQARRLRPRVLAIAASTGGPSALHRLLSELPASFPLPIVIVQHMPDEFMGGLASWLASATPLKVELATQGKVLRAGQIVLGHGAGQMRVVAHGQDLVVQLNPQERNGNYQPSADVLFSSIAQSCGAFAVGLVLTGMGDDGALGLLAMRQAGAITMAQDEASSVVYGMPRAAVERGAVVYIESLNTLSAKLRNLV